MPAPPVPAVELRDGAALPRLGFGVFQVAPDQAAQAVSDAIEAGHRHIDTASAYRNEAEVAGGDPRVGP